MEGPWKSLEAVKLGDILVSWDIYTFITAILEGIRCIKFYVNLTNLGRWKKRREEKKEESSLSRGVQILSEFDVF